MEYKKGKERVCEECYIVLTNNEDASFQRASLRNFKVRTESLFNYSDDDNNKDDEGASVAQL